jgi:hypothetical protein
MWLYISLFTKSERLLSLMPRVVPVTGTKTVKALSIMYFLRVSTCFTYTKRIRIHHATTKQANEPEKKKETTKNIT